MVKTVPSSCPSIFPVPVELFAPAAVDNANFGGGFDLFSDDEDIYRDTSSEKDHILVLF